MSYLDLHLYYMYIIMPHLNEKFRCNKYIKNKISLKPVVNKLVISFNKNIQQNPNYFKNNRSTELITDIRTILNCILFEQILNQKYKYTISKKSIASFYIKKQNKIGFQCILRNVNVLNFIIQFFIFTYMYNINFHGFWINYKDLDKILSYGWNEYSNSLIVQHDFYDWNSIYLYDKNGMNINIYSDYINIYLLNFMFSHYESSFF